MAAKDNEVPQPIIIKKVKKGGHGHHGGAWKVAYADFVTAMMAFFLLMWLLNVTTEEQKNAISNYFDPTHPKVSDVQSGSGGILAGLSVAPDGAQVSNVQRLAPPDSPITPRTGSNIGDQRDRAGAKDSEGDVNNLVIRGEESDDPQQRTDGLNILDEVQNIEVEDIERLKGVIEAAEDLNFEGIQQQILEEVRKSPQLADLEDHLMIDITPEGLRIQIIDKEGRSMFPIGQATMFGFMEDLLKQVTQVIIPQPNQISVRGHTDGKPYPPGAAYNNWNLSADRALSSQNVITQNGLATDRIENVVGKADREHLLPDDPLSPRNRRISIILLREKLENADEIRQKAAEAVRRISEGNSQSQNQQEDRENIPELDQTIDGSARFTIGTGEETFVREPLQQRNQTSETTESQTPQQSQPEPRQLPAPSTTPSQNSNRQVLEF